MADNKPPAFQFYAQDFLTGVMYLTNEEIGIYIKMLAKQWTDGQIPKKRLGFLVNTEWKDFSDELKDKFDDLGDYVTNSRLEKEREKKERFIKKQSENGKKGGRGNKKEEQRKAKRKPKESQIKPLEEEDEIEVENRRKKKEVESKLTLKDFHFTSSFFLNAWKDWLTYRGQIKKPYKTELSERTALNKMVRENVTEERCILSIEQSIANQWQGLFKYKEDEKRNNKKGYDPSNFTPEGIHNIIHAKTIEASS